MDLRQTSTPESSIIIHFDISFPEDWHILPTTPSHFAQLFHNSTDVNFDYTDITDMTVQSEGLISDLDWGEDILLNDVLMIGISWGEDILSDEVLITLEDMSM